jgi:hypothetical protein
VTITNIYPLAYECIQAYLQGPVEYFFDNISDIIYYGSTIANIICQFSLGPFHIICKVLMCIIVVFIVIKTFFFLRIFSQFAPIVVMLQRVVWDLRIFLTFYAILVALSSQMFAVVALGNDYEFLEEGGTPDDLTEGTEYAV